MAFNVEFQSHNDHRQNKWPVDHIPLLSGRQHKYTFSGRVRIRDPMIMVQFQDLFTCWLNKRQVSPGYPSLTFAKSIFLVSSTQDWKKRLTFSWRLQCCNNKAKSRSTRLHIALSKASGYEHGDHMDLGIQDNACQKKYVVSIYCHL